MFHEDIPYFNSIDNHVHNIDKETLSSEPIRRANSIGVDMDKKVKYNGELYH